MVVSLLNKKGSQSYFFNDNNSQDNHVPLGLPSITFSNKNAPGKDIVIPIVTNTHKKNEDETITNEFYLPGSEIICMFYVFYTIGLGIGAILFPYYVAQIALFLAPIFTVTVLSHCFIQFHLYTLILGIFLVVVYPVVIILQLPTLIVTYLMIFTLFCVSKAVMASKSWVYLLIVFVLVCASTMGVIVYEVYPRSIHGMHAAFLCTCILACSNVIFSRKQTYKVVCVSYPSSINVLAS
jgi:hypothetical protein